MTYQALAFFTGLFGSLHCIAMCGPLMMVMPFQHHSVGFLVGQRVLYQIGRIGVYVLLGLIAGMIGKQFQNLGFQNAFSFISGLVLIGAALSYFLPSSKITRLKLNFSLPKRLILLLSKLLTKSYGSIFAGAINGLLPCGMVYMAIAGSLSMPSITQSMVFMLYFGLGTTPMMLIAAFAPLFFKNQLKLSSVTPYLFLLVGFWLCLRGSSLNLGIFPPVNHQKVSDCR